MPDGEPLWHYSEFDRIEDGLGFFFANVLTLGSCMLVVLIAVMDGRQPIELTRSKVGACVLVVLWLVLDIPFLWRLWRTLFGTGRPIGLHVARQQRARGAVLRWGIALWWFGHFLLGISANLTTQGIVKGNDSRVVAIIGSAAALAYGFAANIYLIQAICLLTKDEARQKKLWRLRFVLDVALVVAGHWVGKVR